MDPNQTYRWPEEEQTDPYTDVRDGLFCWLQRGTKLANELLSRIRGYYTWLAKYSANAEYPATDQARDLKAAEDFLG